MQQDGESGVVLGLGPEGAIVAEAVKEGGLPEVEEGSHRGEGTTKELVVEAGGAPDDFIEGFGGLLGHGLWSAPGWTVDCTCIRSAVGDVGWIRAKQCLYKWVTQGHSLST